MDQLLGLVDFVLGIGHDQAVKVFFLVARMGSIGPALTFLDGTFTTNSNLGTRFRFHLLESVATRADK